MRAIAEYAMRGRTQAVTVPAVAAALPLCFWVSAATVALATLRRGWGEGFNVLLWAVLPAAVWVIFQRDPTPIIVIGGTAALAVVLRATVSWLHTLLAGVVLGILVSYLMPLVMPEVVAEIVRVLRKVLEQMAANMASEGGRQLVAGLDEGFASGLLAMVHLMAIVGCLILGRWWQSVLFNPGGFAGEFQALIMPRGVALALAAVMLFGGTLHPVLHGWNPILTVPFLFVAMALAHGVVALRGWSGQWLVAFYLMVFFMGPYFYVFLVVLDSLMDFRGRIRPKAV